MRDAFELRRIHLFLSDEGKLRPRIRTVGGTERLAARNREKGQRKNDRAAHQ